MTQDVEEWASWALLGNPLARVPVTLNELHDRIGQAISEAKRKAIAEEREACAALADDKADSSGYSWDTAEAIAKAIRARGS